MRILIETDLEGAWGVYTMESVSRGDPDFDRAYAELAADINAAAAGAFDAGADEVAVVDGHGPQGLNTALVDPRAQCAKGGLLYDAPFDAMICIGFHAMAGTQNAFLDHTQSSLTWFEYRINGRVCGETAQSAMLAAIWDAPVIMYTGDEAAVAEARCFLGDIQCVAVKRGVGRNRCVMYDKEETRAKIYAAAKKAVSDFIREPASFSPYKPKLPAEMLLTYTRCDYADQAVSNNPALERIGPRTVRKIVESYRDIFP